MVQVLHGRARLVEIIGDRNSPQKHVWRAQIVLLSAQGVGTAAIMRATGKAKTCVWRWQKRFMEVGTEGLLVDKTRPSRIPPLGDAVSERVVALTLTEPPGETTHWTAAAIAAVCAISVSSVHRIWRSHSLRPHQIRQFKLSNDPQFAAFNVLEGSVIGRCMQRHTHQEFIRFLNAIENQVPANKQIHVVLDNYATHKHPKVIEWFGRHDRFVKQANQNPKPFRGPRIQTR